MYSNTNVMTKLTWSVPEVIPFVSHTLQMVWYLYHLMVSSSWTWHYVLSQQSSPMIPIVIVGQCVVWWLEFPMTLAVIILIVNHHYIEHL